MKCRKDQSSGLSNKNSPIDQNSKSHWIIHILKMKSIGQDQPEKLTVSDIHEIQKKDFDFDIFKSKRTIRKNLREELFLKKRLVDRNRSKPNQGYQYWIKTESNAVSTVSNINPPNHLPRDRTYENSIKLPKYTLDFDKPDYETEFKNLEYENLRQKYNCLPKLHSKEALIIYIMRRIRAVRDNVWCNYGDICNVLIGNNIINNVEVKNTLENLNKQSLVIKKSGRDYMTDYALNPSGLTGYFIFNMPNIPSIADKNLDFQTEIQDQIHLSNSKTPLTRNSKKHWLIHMILLAQSGDIKNTWVSADDIVNSQNLLDEIEIVSNMSTLAWEHRNLIKRTKLDGEVKYSLRNNKSLRNTVNKLGTPDKTPSDITMDIDNVFVTSDAHKCANVDAQKILDKSDIEQKYPTSEVFIELAKNFKSCSEANLIKNNLDPNSVQMAFDLNTNYDEINWNLLSGVLNSLGFKGLSKLAEEKKISREQMELIIDI